MAGKQAVIWAQQAKVPGRCVSTLVNVSFKSLAKGVAPKAVRGIVIGGSTAFPDDDDRQPRTPRGRRRRGRLSARMNPAVCRRQVAPSIGLLSQVPACRHAAVNILLSGAGSSRGVKSQHWRCACSCGHTRLRVPMRAVRWAARGQRVDALAHHRARTAGGCRRQRAGAAGRSGRHSLPRSPNCVRRPGDARNRALCLPDGYLFEARL